MLLQHTVILSLAACAIAVDLSTDESSGSHGVFVPIHLVTNPYGDQIWQTLPDGDAYEEMGTKISGVSLYDATYEMYSGIVRVGHVIRFVFDSYSHDVVKMAGPGCDSSGAVVLTGNTAGTYDYTVTEADLDEGTIHFSCSYPQNTYEHCDENQRLAVVISERCGPHEGCANVCTYPSNAWTCWVCEEGYVIEDEEYRCNFYDCAGKCIPASSVVVPGGAFPTGEADPEADAPLSEVDAARRAAPLLVLLLVLSSAPLLVLSRVAHKYT